MDEATPVDSGFTPQNIVDAEWLVANMPGIRRFHDMATYEKAMICHTAARFRATALADMQRRVEIFRQIGRWEMAWEIAFQLEQPLIDCTEGKPEQASFDKAAKLVAASIAAKASRAFSDLPLEVQFGEGEWAEVIEAARQALSDKTQEKNDG